MFDIRYHHSSSPTKPISISDSGQNSGFMFNSGSGDTGLNMKKSGSGLAGTGIIVSKTVSGSGIPNPSFQKSGSGSGTVKVHPGLALPTGWESFNTYRADRSKMAKNAKNGFLALEAE